MAGSFRTRIYCLIVGIGLVRFVFDRYVIMQRNNLDNVKELVVPHIFERDAVDGYDTIQPDVINGDEELCLVKSNWHKRYSVPSNSSATSDSDWTFSSKKYCPRLIIIDVDIQIKRIQKSSLLCSGGIPRLVTSWTNSTRDIAAVDFGDRCLADYISTCCTDDKPVPNIVHYVWYADGELDFFGFVSFISVIRFVRPCLILIHGEFIPRGKYWDYIITLSPSILNVNRERPLSYFGKKIKFRENSGDIMRIEALIEYGGIYLDTDTILVRPIDLLREYECTISVQDKNKNMGSAFIVAKKNSTFMQYWLDSYRTDFKTDNYTYNAMKVPRKLAVDFKELIHVEENTVSRPDGYFGLSIYEKNYNWSGLYGMHLYKRLYNSHNKLNFTVPMTETVIRSFNSSVGSMCRHILFGIKDLCKENSDTWV